MEQDRLDLELKLLQEKEKLSYQNKKVMLAETALILLEAKEAAKKWTGKNK